MTDANNSDKPFDTLPLTIVDALRELDGPAVLPDAEHDADVFSGARQHLGSIHRKRRNFRLFIGGAAGGALAAAAMVGIVVMLGNPTGTPQDAEMWAADELPTLALKEASPVPETLLNQGDLDTNGRIDILDAYALARGIERGNPSANADLNADGTIDQRDIDWLANRAVALNTGEQG